MTAGDFRTVLEFPEPGTSERPALSARRGRRPAGTHEPVCASKGLMAREIGLGSLLILVTGLALWVVSHPTAGGGTVTGIQGKPVGVTPAYWQLAPTREVPRSLP